MALPLPLLLLRLSECMRSRSLYPLTPESTGVVKLWDYDGEHFGADTVSFTTWIVVNLQV